jgi:hypothetical protein
LIGYSSNPFDEKYRDPILFIATNTLAQELKNFRDKECRTVWTIDTNPTMIHFEQAWIRFYEQEGESALKDLTSRFRFPSDSLGLRILMMSSGTKRLLLYKKNQYKSFSEAMRTVGLTVDLNFVATWDNERPIAEEFMIMGLFGDIEPCESQLRPERVQEYINKILKDSKRRRDELNMSPKEVDDHRLEMWERFLRAYHHFIEQAYDIVETDWVGFFGIA